MTQFYVICFDICNKKRLRRVAIQMENFGQRVQYSVFECYLTQTDLKTLKKRLASIINDQEDHIRYYGLCNKDQKKIIMDGRGSKTPNDDYFLL